jgi:hypothetical protein
MARGIQFAVQPRNRDTAWSRQMRFDMICEANGIAHRLTKPNHPWTNGQVERMSRTIKDATVKRFHSDSHDQLRAHLGDFRAACNFARRLKTLGGLTPCEHLCKLRTSESDKFIVNPIHQMPGLNSPARPSCAREALDRIGALHDIERSITGQPAEVRRAVRQEQSRPRVEAFRAWAEQQLTRIPGQGDLARAFRHGLWRWPSFCLFLDDGRVAVDENPAERALRPIGSGQEDWLFEGADTGAETRARAMTARSTGSTNSCHGTGRPPAVTRTWNKIAAAADTPGQIVRTLDGLIDHVMQPGTMRLRLEGLASVVPAVSSAAAGRSGRAAPTARHAAPGGRAGRRAGRSRARAGAWR